MIVLITGGAGFIGSAMVRNLLQDKENTVINVDNLSYSSNLASIPLELQHQNYIFEKCDIVNKKNIFRVIDKYQPNVIFHLAAESHVDRSIEGPRPFIDSNIIGTYNLLEASKILCSKNNSIAGASFRFHHISTDEVFGDLEIGEAMFNERSLYNPSSPYAASKAASDHLVRSWGRTYDIPYVITNCSNNYGPYQFPEKLIPHTIINALKGNNLPVYGNGTQIRDWLYVDDHVEALKLVVRKSKSNQTYVVGGNNEIQNIDVVKEICSYLDEIIKIKPNQISSFHDLVKFVKDRPGHDKRYAIDASKLISELSWKPKESFTSGLKKTIDWYVQNIEWWENTLSDFHVAGRIDLSDKEHQ
jgi:dTDP-glucose 4,6-dehydratase